jgi:hypothetical protein
VGNLSAGYLSEAGASNQKFVKFQQVQDILKVFG